MTPPAAGPPPPRLRPPGVHLAAWPQVDEGAIDEKLNSDMALVMKLTSLGHAARNKANRKVRQPLAEVAFSVGNADEERVVMDYADLLADELNVKEVRLLNAAGEAVDYSLNPLPKQLGQKYGNQFPEIRKVILGLNAEQMAMKLLAGEAIQVEITGKMLEILPEEVEVRLKAHEGYSVASEGAYLAALVTDLSPELIAEGLAREFVRRVQDLRKTADMDIANRITIIYDATPNLKKAVENYRDYIMTETLAVEMVNGEPGAEMFKAEDAFDGEKVNIGISKH